MLSRLQELLGFTRNEIKVVLFLTTTLLAGLVVRWTGLVDRTTPLQDFDYEGIDRDFLTRTASFDSSSQIPPGFSLQQPARTPLQDNEIQLNTATKADLIRLPGIGNEYAERIIDYRNEHGPFTTVEELRNVRGIGKKRIEQIRRFLTLR